MFSPPPPPGAPEEFEPWVPEHSKNLCSILPVSITFLWLLQLAVVSTVARCDESTQSCFV